MSYGKLNGDVTDGDTTRKGQGHDPNTLRAQYLEDSWRLLLINNLLLLDTVGYPIDSLASCYASCHSHVQTSIMKC